ncbi:MAG: peptidoglycan DD-metalloendopeptidase family protein [Dethiobacter sp.]|jgi:murein DD-endopeptidase MepM/ murein hydrolase activator NlpD|nr:peptidoglycan DD-metalloendopeptidase family protein [Dethiobacter sp.]
MFYRHYRWLLCLALLLFLSASAVLPTFANPLEERRREQAEIQRQLDAERNNLKQHRDRELSLNQELDQLNRRLEALQAEKERLAAEIQRTEQEITVAEADLAEAEEALAVQSDLLHRRIRAIHEQGSVTYLEVLLSASSFSDFLTRLHNLKIIASNDLRLVEEHQAERDRIQIVKAELEQKKVELEEMRRQTVANEAEIEKAAEAREQVLADLQAEIAQNIRAIQDLENEADNLARIIASLLPADQGTRPQGQLYWPIEPPYVITSPFGRRRDPFTGTQAWHGGLDIAPRNGAPNFILAADDGRVILSGWNGAYGNCIMIDHRNGLVTAYGHMSSLLVRAGDWVEKGQRIARAGTTGRSTGVHLHFEVWDYNRDPLRSAFPNDRRQNPMDYL